MSTDVEARLTAARIETARILGACAEGRELSWEDAVTLSAANGADLHALTATADARRAAQAGDAVTYVVNRNVNFTNACIKTCHFCAFSRLQRSEEAYFLTEDEIVRRAVEARDLGATELCLQAGLAPGMDGAFYAQVLRAVKAAAPELHLHAYSPEEVKYGAHLRRVSIREHLEELRDAGLGSLPGTSAEILDDEVRARIAPGRITSAEWIDVITTAHHLGIPTTSTVMFGHVESATDRARHFDLLRRVQRETRGFTEIVPLSFVHHEAPMFARNLVPGLRAGPTGNDVVRLFAIARLMLGETFVNVQASWVKEGIRTAQFLLACGANDLGGTLMNESISTSAGAAHGQAMTPAALRAAIRDAGRAPAQRDTRYRIVRTFGATAAEDAAEPLDAIDDPDATFGTYAALTRDARFRFADRPKASRTLRRA